MADWTVGRTEYEHARNLILQTVFGEVTVWLKSGRKIEGIVVGQSSGTDVGKNLQAGRPPVVTSMWGEIKLRLADDTVMVISVRDIERIEMKNPV